MSADTSELDQFIRDLERAPQRVGAEAARIVRTTAAAAERTMKSLAPVDEGNLRDSVSTTITGDGRYTVMTAEIGPTLRDEKGRPIPVFVEFGTSRSAPRPFVTPTADQHIPEFEQALDDVMKGIL